MKSNQTIRQSDRIPMKPLMTTTTKSTSRKTKTTKAAIPARLSPSQHPDRINWLAALQAHLFPSQHLAPISRQPGSRWRQGSLQRSRRMSRTMFSNACLSTWPNSWKKLRILGSWTPSRSLYKRMLPYFSPEEESWATLLANRRFRRFAMSARTSNRTGQPKIELCPGRTK